MSIQAREEAREIEQADRQFENDQLFRAVFGTREGQKVLHILEQDFRFRDSVFFPVNHGSHFAYDALTAAKTDGGRGVLAYIHNRLTREQPTPKPKAKAKR